jgi:predicted Rdx family selenoprotein
VTLTPGKVGEYTVLADGEVVWAKSRQGRFPEPKEILEQLVTAY